MTTTKLCGGCGDDQLDDLVPCIKCDVKACDCLATDKWTATEDGSICDACTLNKKRRRVRRVSPGMEKMEICMQMITVLLGALTTAMGPDGESVVEHESLLDEGDLIDTMRQLLSSAHKIMNDDSSVDVPQFLTELDKFSQHYIIVRKDGEIVHGKFLAGAELVFPPASKRSRHARVPHPPATDK